MMMVVVMMVMIVFIIILVVIVIKFTCLFFQQSPNGRSQWLGECTVGLLV